MHDWLIVGTLWILCAAKVDAFKHAVVTTYDGRELKGIAHRGLYGWIVVKQEQTK